MRKAITTIVRVILLTGLVILLGILVGRSAQRLVDAREASREEIRDNSYWLSEEFRGWPVFDLRLYLSDHGCKSPRAKRTNLASSGEHLYSYQFERNGAEFDLSTLLQPHEADSQNIQYSLDGKLLYDVTGSRLRVVLSNGTEITSQPEIAERPWLNQDELLVYTAEKDFACSRSALGQLFYIIQHKLDDPANWTDETITELQNIGLDVITITTE